jgi:hypothetical protein
MAILSEALPVRTMIGVGEATTRGNDRPIAEGASILRRSSIHYQRLRMPGVRMGKDGQGVEANVEAYREMLPRQEQLYANLAWIRELVVGPSFTNELTVGQLLDITALGKSIAPLLLHRAQNPFGPEGELPETIGDLDKAFQGLFAAAINLVGIGGLQLDSLAPSAQEMYRSVDEGSSPKLVTFDQTKGCPAPPPVITDSFSILLRGPKSNGEQVYSRDSDIPQLLNVDQLKRFAEVFKNFELLRLRSKAKAMAIRDREISRRGHIDDSVLLGLQQLELHREIGEAAEYQVIMNMVLGRDPHGPFIGIKELLF